MAQRIQEIANGLDNSDDSEENNTFGFEGPKSENHPIHARRASSSMVLNLRTDTTPQKDKEVTPNFMGTKLSGKKKHNFRLGAAEAEPKEEIGGGGYCFKSGGRVQVRFEPGKEDLYDSYVTRFR